MKNKTNDPFANLILDNYEQETENAIPDDFTFPKISAKEKAALANIAIKHKELKRSKRINIRINNEDLAKVKAKAKKHKIPYQTLIGSVVHKYAEGDITIML